MDVAGVVRARASRAYVTSTAQPGWAEQDPGEWLAAAAEALRDLVSSLPTSAVPRAMAVTGQMPTLVLLDGEDRPVRPAIVWHDGRAEEEAEALLAAIPSPEWYRRSGIVLDGHYLAPMYDWVRAHEPPLARASRRLCSAKDAVVLVLTGSYVTDPSTASGYGVYAPLRRAWDERLLASAGIAPETLPAVVDSCAIAGGLAPAWKSTGLPVGLPVIAGAADALAGVLGCGAAGANVLTIVNGTSSSLVLGSREPALDGSCRFLLTPHALPDLWGLEMDLMSTGSALRWLAELVDPDQQHDVFERAAGSPAGARGVVALPYLAGGEQGALWDPRVPAALIGLRLEHTADDLARAMLEGIVFEIRRCISVWEGAGVPVQEVVAGGGFGGRRFAPFAASVLGRPVREAGPDAGSALGAALLAAIGVGAMDAGKAAALCRRQGGGISEPDAALTGRYAELYARYEHVTAIARERLGPAMAQYSP